ncbi:MAG: acetyltransferase [Clostridium sp.]
MKNLIIIGAGGVAKEVSLIVEQLNYLKPTWNLIGFIDDNIKKFGEIINGYSVIGGFETLNAYEGNCSVIIAIADYKVKKSIVKRLKNRFTYATIINPRVWVHEYMRVGEGSIIYEGAIITSNVEIGKHVLISPKCGIGHDSIIKDYVSLLWNVNISGTDVIEEGVLIGSGATVVQNKVIGQGAIIGAGAVVINDIPSGSIVVGVPGRIKVK